MLILMKGISLTDPIPPLQGLEGINVLYRIGRCPMLNVFCAYSATGLLRALKGQAYIKAGQRPAENPYMIYTSPEGA
jgi:hypothetical protein